MVALALPSEVDYHLLSSIAPVPDIKKFTLDITNMKTTLLCGRSIIKLVCAEELPFKMNE